MAMSLRVVVPPHPLIAHWLFVLRDAATPSPLVGTAMAELGRWLGYEALRDWLPQRSVCLPPEQGGVDGQVIDAAVPVLVIPVLASGLALWEGARSVLPAAALAPVAFRADGLDSSQLPRRIGERVGVLVFTGQIGSARSLLLLLQHLRELGVEGPRLRVLTTVAAAPGLKLLGETVPELTVYCACIDPEIDAGGRIRPGIGAADQRFTGVDPEGCLG